MKVLANDGISKNGIKKLESNNFVVINSKIEQEHLIDFINENNIEVLLVRSATKARKELIDKCPNLKIIGRGGVGMDNIDVEYAKNKGIHVINTPTASSLSVAELVFSHFFNLARYIHDSNRNMPLDGETKFKIFKKKYSKGTELSGKNLGIIGFGKIGQEVAKIGLGLGMKLIVHDKFINESDIKLTFFDNQTVNFKIKTTCLEDVISQSDFITFHIPKESDKALIGKKEFKIMKDGVCLVNTARGGIIDENELIKALENGKVRSAGLDVFQNEPNPSIKILMNEKISLSPHIGGSTIEAQNRIGIELANQIINLYK
tara:strand:- start:366 stop:1319 length:954 start_codon:yes stop_codon:yes gene_type:complete